ncbi:cuticle protein 18.6-like [Macrobrachium rosenbergii]|uniref:cuticle protein 18.6-like n=1 Tax=Macrobrachium rosenbergii TaxID=79674 RepID=UPI0034D47EF9
MPTVHHTRCTDGITALRGDSQNHQKWILFNFQGHITAGTEKNDQVILLCLAVATLAIPHKLAPSGYGYSVPEHPLSYAPQAPAYEAPEPSYSAPKTSYKVPSYEEEDEGKPFEFEYAVQDHYNGLDFGHNENSDGTVVSGQYRVLLPDGRTQIVTYTADADNGYQAEVTYEGEAQYPEPHPHKPAPSYHAPAHSYSAPAHSHSAPAHSYSAPSHSYSAPSHSYSAPSHSYSTPTHSYSAPEHSYSAPAHSYSAPAHSYSAPEHSYSAALHTYGQPHGNPHH